MIPGSYNAIGTACSAGCLRTTCSAAAWIYHNCPIGTKVTIANDSKYTANPLSHVPDTQTYDPTDPGAKPEIPITRFDLSSGAIDLKVGESATVEIQNVIPSNHSAGGFVISTDNESVSAKMSGNSVQVTGLSPGRSVVRITADDISGISRTLVVNVSKIPVTGFQASASATKLLQGESAKITVSAVKPDNASVKSVRFISTQADIASVAADGTVLAIKAGQTTIRVIVDEVEKTITITVSAAPTPKPTAIPTPKPTAPPKPTVTPTPNPTSTPTEAPTEPSSEPTETGETTTESTSEPTEPTTETSTNTAEAANSP